MKKLILIGLLLATTGCAFIDKAKGNIKDEIGSTKVAVVNTNDGFVFMEEGKFYFQKDMNSNPEQIDIKDVGMYAVKVIIK